MQYDDAREIMATHKTNVLNGHGKVGSLATNRKFLKYRTFLSRKESNNDETPEHYEIEYFGNTIIRFRKDTVSINDQGWFAYSTHERLNEYMPNGFRVHGNKPSWYHSTLGFVRTPKGVFPYDMEMTFTYEGHSTQDYSAAAGPSLHLIPSYVDAFLDRVLAGEKSTVERFYLKNEAMGDCNWPVRLLQEQRYAPNLLHWVTRASNIPKGLLADYHAFFRLELEDLADIVLSEGASVLRKPKTHAEMASYAEASLRMQRHIPTTRLPTLRKNLRLLLIEFLVTELGFNPKTWNRR